MPSKNYRTHWEHRCPDGTARAHTVEHHGEPGALVQFVRMHTMARFGTGFGAVWMDVETAGGWSLIPVTF